MFKYRLFRSHFIELIDHHSVNLVYSIGFVRAHLRMVIFTDTEWCHSFIITIHMQSEHPQTSRHHFQVRRATGILLVVVHNLSQFRFLILLNIIR